MRALVHLMLMAVMALVGLMVIISIASVFLAVLLPTLGAAIPELGRELGYGRTGDLALTPLIGVVPLAGFALMLLFCLAIVVVAMKTVGREPSRAKSKDAMEETRLIQELFHGMSRMEQRIESLETLLLDRAVPPEFKPSEPRRTTSAR